MLNKLYVNFVLQIANIGATAWVQFAQQKVPHHWLFYTMLILIETLCISMHARV